MESNPKICKSMSLAEFQEEAALVKLGGQDLAGAKGVIRPAQIQILLSLVRDLKYNI